MTRWLDRPGPGRETSDTKRRVHSLERELSRRQPNVAPFEIVYSLPGLLYLSESGRGRHPTGGRLVTVEAYLQTAGSTATTIRLKKSGATIDDIIIPAGITYALSGFDEIFSARLSVLTVEVTVAGTDAEDLTVFAQFDQ